MDSLQKKQRGATLLVSLVLLLLLTVLALTSARTAMLQQRMSSNLQQKNLAFQAAENGITAAILRLKSSNTDKWPALNATKELCGTTNNFADWNSCSSSSQQNDTSHYKAKVKQVTCSAQNSSFFCFDISSKGTYGLNSVTHKQGYIFKTKPSG